MVRTRLGRVGDRASALRVAHSLAFAVHQHLSSRWRQQETDTLVSAAASFLALLPSLGCISRVTRSLVVVVAPALRKRNRAGQSPSSPAQRDTMA
jgi:hypothetical protein